MKVWRTNFRKLQQKGILNSDDYDEMIRRFHHWATHLALAQEDPLLTTREKLFERAQRLYYRVRL